jgi:hypothetical protein
MTYLMLILLNEVVDETVVEALTNQVGVTSGGLNLEDTPLDSKEEIMEGSSTRIENEDVALALGLLVETAGDGGGLFNDKEDVHVGDDADVLGGLTLEVVEVGDDDDDGVVDGGLRYDVGPFILRRTVEISLRDWEVRLDEMSGVNKYIYTCVCVCVCEGCTNSLVSPRYSADVGPCRRNGGGNVLCRTGPQHPRTCDR